jgi:Tol biopolymer transport system component
MPSQLTGKTLLLQYHIEEYITATPLGEQYRAVDERTNKSLSLILLDKKISDDADALKELEAKSKKLQNIQHPNLAKYFGLYQTPTSAFFLEEWVDGPSLTNILEQKQLSAEETLIYTKALCNVLHALHQQKFLHLNLSPEFVKINQKGEIFLIGIANATPINQKSSRTLSKYPPLYTSPEEIKKQNLTPASDVYSLAVLLYQLTTGKWINGKQIPKTNEAIRKTHLELNPPTPISLNKNIPDHFSRMILWALRKNPDERLKDTTELLSSLALSIRTSVDEIPLQALGKVAPVTSALIHSWSFLSPPKPTIYTDAIPLEERLATVTAPKKKSSSFRLTPILFLILVAGIISLFFLIRPVEIPAVITLPTLTPFVPDTPTPTFTPEPIPTKEFGGQIVFTCTRDNYNQLCIVNRDGSGYTQLTDMAASNYYPTFALDGLLLFASNRNGAFDFYLWNFNLREITQITNNVGNVISPDYSPDGRQIVFANKVDNSPISIWIMNADGLNPKLVFTGVNDIAAVAWSPNGEKIAYAMSTEVFGEYEIYTMDVNGKNHLKISKGLLGIGGSVDWSIDSKYLLIYAGAFGDKNIFRIEVTTSNFLQLTNGGNNAGASYSPDGNYIVFNSLRNDDQADLYIMRADGTNQVQLTNRPEPEWGARWDR